MAIETQSKDDLVKRIESCDLKVLENLEQLFAVIGYNQTMGIVNSIPKDADSKNRQFIYKFYEKALDHAQKTEGYKYLVKYYEFLLDKLKKNFPELSK